MRRWNWNTIFTGLQAAAAVAVAVLAFWAFFFSSLSQNLEEHLRTEVTLAKQELIAAKHSKAIVEAEKDRLVAATQTLTQARETLASELDSLERQLSTLREDRSAYAQSTKLIANTRYAVMVKYELAHLRKIAQICSDYNQHLNWLALNREFFKLDKQWSKLSFDQQYSDKHPISRRRSELEFHKSRFRAPDIWWGMPREPQLTPGSPSDIVFTGHEVRLWNGGLTDNPNAHEELNAYLFGWLLEHIAENKGVRPMTGATFIDKTKQYPFLSMLLPKERDELYSNIDAFMLGKPDFRQLQVNATVIADPAARDIIAAGKKYLPQIASFEREFLAHLASMGIAEKTETDKSR